MNDSNLQKRKNIRFEPSPNTLAWICVSSTLPYQFKKDIVGLVIEESLGGCGVVVHWDGKFHIDNHVIIKVGELEPTRSIIKAVTELKKHIYILGVEYQLQATSED